MALPGITRDLNALARLATRPDQIHDMLSQTLLALRGVIPYDLAVLYALEGEVLHVRAAEGPLVDDAVRRHSLPLARFPSIRRALATRRPVPMEEHDHTGEGDPYDGVLDLPPGHSCMVVPLHANGRDLGIITLDRQVCTVYDDQSVLLAGLFGHLVGAAMMYAQQAALLDRYRHRLKEHNRLLREELDVGVSATAKLEAAVSDQMRALVRMVHAAAATDAPVLITGETGSGKEVVGEALHAWSKRAGGAFVTLNCASIPEPLFESELFGHVKGAFSGADRVRTGRFVTADGGTLFLDEIGDMPLAQQAKLLRVLQSGQVTPVGADTSVTVDVRVVAATHVDLAAAVEAGTFREDLYYRLAVFPVHVPALRERPEDVISIAQSWLDAHARRTARGPWGLDPDAVEVLRSHPWPGNVRELLNVLERATILTARGPLRAEDLSLGSRPRRPAPSRSTPLGSFEANERAYLQALLERTEGRVYGDGGAADVAGLKPTTLYSKLKKHGLK